MRLVDADEFYKLPCVHGAEGTWICLEDIRNAPTVDAEPVRHGGWVFSPDHAEGICTSCNYKIYGRPYQNTYLIVPYNYCPNCGAKMEVEDV